MTRERADSAAFKTAQWHRRRRGRERKGPSATSDARLESRGVTGCGGLPPPLIGFASPTFAVFHLVHLSCHPLFIQLVVLSSREMKPRFAFMPYYWRISRQHHTKPMQPRGTPRRVHCPVLPYQLTFQMADEVLTYYVSMHKPRQPKPRIIATDYRTLPVEFRCSESLCRIPPL